MANEGLATSADVFCDPAAYSHEQSRQILDAARAAGLGSRVHADQPLRIRWGHARGAIRCALGRPPGAYLGHRNRAVGSPQTVAVLIPGSLLFVPGEVAPPVRQMIDRGVAIAVASDYNPGTSPIASQAMAASLACVLMRISVAEGLARPPSMRHSRSARGTRSAAWRSASGQT